MVFKINFKIISDRPLSRKLNPVGSFTALVNDKVGYQSSREAYQERQGSGQPIVAVLGSHSSIGYIS